jgi:hypothetical protein
VTIPSLVLEDMEVGDTFLFDSDMDRLAGYPAFGGSAPVSSWTQRTFFALEAHTNFGSAWHTEIVAMDLND